jgi:hypothetical protein
VYLGYFGASRKEWLMEWMARSQFGFLILMLGIVLALAIVTLVKKKLHGLAEKLEEDGA